MNQKATAAAAIIAAVVGGGSLFTYSVVNTTNIEGDTIFNNLIDEEEIAVAVLEKVCELDIIPDQYQEACDNWDP